MDQNQRVLTSKWVDFIDNIYIIEGSHCEPFFYLANNLTEQ
jgi:hypothetical protein